MTTFVEVTRVYIEETFAADGYTVIRSAPKTQKNTVDARSVIRVRAHNKKVLEPQHRSTLTLVDGTELNVTETYQDLVAKLSAAVGQRVSPATTPIAPSSTSTGVSESRVRTLISELLPTMVREELNRRFR